MDLSPLARRDFRLLFAGQFVSSFGSMMTHVALPYALYQATKSTVLMGVLGVIQLVPLVVSGLFGGALADAVDRRRLIIGCELGMAAVVLLLALALQLLPSGLLLTGALLGAALLLSALNGFHRPALEALTPRLVDTSELPAIGVLSSFRSNVAMIAGPALAGILLAVSSTQLVFLLDGLTFLLCAAAMVALRNVPANERPTPFALTAVAEGFSYALSRPDLIGTYVIDIVAMTFSMPNLLFPAVAEAFGSTARLGWLHSAISVGALVATVTSRRLFRTRRHGLMILIAAGVWSLCMAGFGLATSFPLALVFLLLAGYADMVSGVFRMTIWNETIPDHLRGRLAGIEMISYLSGPMLGNAQLGFLASMLGVQHAIFSSSLCGFVGVLACALLIPALARYRAVEAHAPGSVHPT